MTKTNSADKFSAKISRRFFAALGLGAILPVARAAAATPAAGGSRLSVEDRLDIADLFARYAWAYDCSDVDSFVQTFTPDGVIEAFGSEAARGRPAIAKFIQTLFAERGDVDWQHYNDHLRFAGSGQACTVYSYWGLLAGNAKEGSYGVRSFGYYLSECVKVDGLWYLKKRSINRWNRSKLPWK